MIEPFSCIVCVGDLQRAVAELSRGVSRSQNSPAKSVDVILQHGKLFMVGRRNGFTRTYSVFAEAAFDKTGRVQTDITMLDTLLSGFEAGDIAYLTVSTTGLGLRKLFSAFMALVDFTAQEVEANGDNVDTRNSGTNPAGDEA